MAINLDKGTTLNLEKNGSVLTKIRMGLGWDPAAAAPAVKPKGFLARLGQIPQAVSKDDIDLDASCVMVDERGREIDSVWFSHKDTGDRSLHHTGDNLTGEGEGDDESIIVDLTRIPAKVHALFFTINSYRGQSFDLIANASCHVVDLSSGHETDMGTMVLSRSNDDFTGSHNSAIMAKVVRSGNGWQLEMVGETMKAGKTYHSLMDRVRQLV